MVVALIALGGALAVSVFVNACFWVSRRKDKRLIRQMQEYNIRVGKEYDEAIDDIRASLDHVRGAYLGLLMSVRSLDFQNVSITKRDDKGRFCGRVTVQQILRGEI